MSPAHAHLLTLVRCSCVAAVLCGGVSAASPCSAPGACGAADTVASVQQVIDELREGLFLTVPVTASMVSSNPLLVSVEFAQGRDDAFQLSFEDGFIETLDDDELRAVVAHELGHVWIFTHHPYLQTERLANDIAMRIVSRESLERVYGKVWARKGLKGDIARFLGR
jgi:Peptidase family M48